MENNERILKEYGKQIASYSKLTYSEAKDLYTKYVNTEDSKEKKKYMDELILGTLYVVYKYIKEKDVLMFCTRDYDANDIISAFNETWIRRLHDGALLKATCYSAILYKPTFINKVYESLGGQSVDLPAICKLNIKQFTELLMKYLKAEYNGENFSYYSEIAKELGENVDQDYWYSLFSSSWQYWREYLASYLLNSIVENLKLDEVVNWQELEIRLKNFLPFVINLGMEASLNNNWLTEDNVEAVLQKKLISEAFKELLDEIEIVGGERSHNGRRGKLVKAIMMLRYGFIDNDVKTFAEIGEIINVSEKRVQQLSAYSLHLMHHHRVLRKLNQCIFYMEER